MSKCIWTYWFLVCLQCWYFRSSKQTTFMNSFFLSFEWLLFIFQRHCCVLVVSIERLNFRYQTKSVLSYISLLFVFSLLKISNTYYYYYCVSNLQYILLLSHKLQYIHYCCLKRRHEHALCRFTHKSSLKCRPTSTLRNSLVVLKYFSIVSIRLNFLYWKFVRKKK